MPTLGCVKCKCIHVKMENHIQSLLLTLEAFVKSFTGTELLHQFPACKPASLLFLCTKSAMVHETSQADTHTQHQLNCPKCKVPENVRWGTAASTLLTAATGLPIRPVSALKVLKSQLRAHENASPHVAFASALILVALRELPRGCLRTEAAAESQRWPKHHCRFSIFGGTNRYHRVKSNAYLFQNGEEDPEGRDESHTANRVIYFYIYISFIFLRKKEAQTTDSYNITMIIISVIVPDKTSAQVTCRHDVTVLQGSTDVNV
ncbi:hypothetical protein F2P81_013669 [Scophthalmus maximus]|uniref:Uncharacterized protein n=1 Tax=Scophthalmus maximus TaxID=52904 RepID=A0A6A4SHI3_SCOMX|nr:hypothetical protein F2P81_013669 [Scophthalmus maximus]